MTLANDAFPTTITLILRDVAQNAVSKTFVIPTGVWDPASDLFSALVTIRDNLVTKYNLVTAALIYKAFITVAQTEDTATVGGAGTEIAVNASIVGNLATAGKTATIAIPAPEVGIFTGSSGPALNIVDIADTDLVSFVDEYKAAGDFVISDGENLDATTPLDSGKRLTRRSNKKLK